MDDRLRELLQNLGNAVDQSLYDSDCIAEAIKKINQTGYNIELLLEVSIVFRRREEVGSEVVGEPEVLAEPFSVNGHTHFTSQDLKFMKALKIDLRNDE